jgi:hypothetical protein
VADVILQMVLAEVSFAPCAGVEDQILAPTVNEKYDIRYKQKNMIFTQDFRR